MEPTGPFGHKLFRIVFWNVWYRAPHDEVIKHLQTLNPDVMCLFEATAISPYNRTSLHEELLEEFSVGLDASRWATTRTQPTFLTTIRDTIKTLEGSVIIARPGVQVLGTNDIVLSSGGRLASGTSARHLLTMTLGLASRQRLTIGACHLSYPSPLPSHRARSREEFRRLHAWYAEMKREAPVILGGGFNQPLNLLESRWSPLDPSMTSFDWRPDSEPTCHTGLGPVVSDAPRFKLDYVMWSPEETPFGTLAAESSLGHRGPSNHRPIIVDISS